jgi:hypothetical protein
MAYCEVRLTLKYGQEVPIENTYCPGGITCTALDGTSATFRTIDTINPVSSIQKKRRN